MSSVCVTDGAEYDAAAFGGEEKGVCPVETGSVENGGF